MDNNAVTKLESFPSDNSFSSPLSFGEEQAAEVGSQLLNFSTPQSLLLSYALHNPDTKPRHFPHIFKIMKAVCEVGHEIFPVQIKSLVAGKTMLDLGCGNTLYGAAFRALGATAYVGVDERLDITQRQFRSRHLKKKIKLDVSIENILGRILNIEYYLSTSNLKNQSFDLVVMHNVTEHLLDLDDVLDRVSALLRPGGRVWFLHTNFYSWSGHLQEPRHPKHLDAANAAHLKYADWAHILFEPPHDHPFRTALNRIRLADLRTALERRFTIEDWVENEDGPPFRLRLTPEVERRYDGFSRHELLTKNVICQAQKAV